MSDEQRHWADGLYWAMTQERFPKGDLAELRRGLSRHRAGQASPALWKTLVQNLPEEDWPQTDRRERQMQVVCGLLAELARQPQGPSSSLGRALAQGEANEARVLRLLKAHGEELHDSLRGIVHLLASQGRRVRPSEIAWLVLADGTEHQDEPRRSIARDFYSQTKGTASKEN